MRPARYDKYYQTPRVWLLGYSPARAPLSQAETFEDIPADHAHKTVTYEVFPCVAAVGPLLLALVGEGLT